MKITLEDGTEVQISKESYNELAKAVKKYEFTVPEKINFVFFKDIYSVGLVYNNHVLFLANGRWNVTDMKTKPILFQNDSTFEITNKIKLKLVDKLEKGKFYFCTNIPIESISKNHSVFNTQKRYKLYDGNKLISLDQHGVKYLSVGDYKTIFEVHIKGYFL